MKTTMGTARSAGSLVPNGAMAMVRELGGRVTYRQLDYWLRTGWIRIKSDAAGSGSERVFTDAERQAFIDLVDEIDAINRRQEEIKSGAFFRQRLALAEGNIDALHTEETAAHT